jgi:hypothetical protein
MNEDDLIEMERWLDAAEDRCRELHWSADTAWNEINSKMRALIEAVRKRDRDLAALTERIEKAPFLWITFLGDYISESHAYVYFDGHPHPLSRDTLKRLNLKDGLSAKLRLILEPVTSNPPEIPESSEEENLDDIKCP